MTVSELYKDAVESLAPAERLQLATMLLETLSPAVVIDDSEEWTEEDLREYGAQCRRRLEARTGTESLNADSQTR